MADIRRRPRVSTALRVLGPRGEPADERGFTLIEMLITMSIFGMVAALVMAALIQTQKFSTKVQASADAVSQLRQALEVIDRQVRSGNVLYSPAAETLPSSCTATGLAAGSCMRIYTQANGINRCVQWQELVKTGDNTATLRSRSWSPDWQSDGSYTAWNTVATGLKIVSTPPFSLVNSSGVVTAGNANASTGRYLAVNFTAIDPRYAGKTVSISGSLSGRNTNYGFNGGLCISTPPEIGS